MTNYDLKANTFSASVKDEAHDRIQIEIGDSKQADFLPQLKIMRWDNEVNFSLRLKTDSPNAGSYILDGETVKYSEGSLAAHFYSLEKDNHLFEDGGHEFEVILSSIPKSNVIEYTIQTKGLDFFKQLPLTNEELKRGAIRPDNIINSYAVYHSTKKHNIVDESGNPIASYKTGKFCHIYRPYAIDASANKVWCDLDIDTDSGIASITIPQGFLDSAIYPVIVDPTFGYTGIGGTQDTSGSPNTYFNSFNMNAENGTGVSISVYTQGSGGSAFNTSMNVYNTSGGNPNTVVAGADTGSVSFNNNAGNVWFTANNGGSPSYLNGATYWLALLVGTIYYDSGGANQFAFQAETAPDTWVTPFSGTNLGAGIIAPLSIYATYTVSGGGASAPMVIIIS